jgi:CheY-like chemotaxis protein
MEAMRRATPDLLVCDVGLPGEDGFELIRGVRALEAEKGGRIPALALTADAGRTQLENALAAGFDRLLSKSVAPAELVAQAALLSGPRGGS